MDNFSIIRIKGENQEKIDDSVAEEFPLGIYSDKKEIVTLLCSPSHLEDLVTGFLYAGGIIRSIEDMESTVIDASKGEAVVRLSMESRMKMAASKKMSTSGCAHGVLFYDNFLCLKEADIRTEITLTRRFILDLMKDLKQRADLYQRTGGVHSAALADREGILFFREDIGRHNAIDKVIGASLRSGISPEDKILVTSGRISSEVLFKAKNAKIPFVLSRGAPTDRAIMMARETSITLVGFIRGNRMNVYSEDSRIEEA